MPKIYLLYTENDWSDNSDYLLLSAEQVLPEVDSWGSACISSEEVPEGANRLFTRQDEEGISVYSPGDESFEFDTKTDKKWTLLNNGDWVEVSEWDSDDDRLYKIFLGDELFRQLDEADPDLYRECDDYYELCKRCADHLFERICQVMPELTDRHVVDESFAPTDEKNCHCDLCDKKLDPRT